MFLAWATNGRFRENVMSASPISVGWANFLFVSGFQSMAGARFNEVVAAMLSDDPRLSMTGPEEPDRKLLLPL